MQVDVLAFAAHPDDIELACAGLILKLKSQGYKTGIIDLTRGELGTRGDVKTREKEAGESSRILGLDIRENAGLADGNICSDQKSQRMVIGFIRKYKPKLILAPYWRDRHPDHEEASHLVSKAFFYSGLSKIKTDSEAYRPRNIIYYFQHEIFEPSFIVDISEEFETKLKAIKAFKSQFYMENSKEPETYISKPEFLDSVTTKAKYFGHRIGVKYGEPFLVKSKIKVTNIVKLFT
jgi:bacillithiol biosynthesis deacetylase BshB1